MLSNILPTINNQGDVRTQAVKITKKGEAAFINKMQNQD